jgi:5-formyltetrahydrofolate cyclo-ligase
VDRAKLRRRLAMMTTPEGRAVDSSAITGAILDSKAWRNARRVFCYISIGSEVSTAGLIRAAVGQGKTLCAPRVLAEPGLMEAALFDENSLERGLFGIPSPARSAAVAPESIDLVILPGLAFGRNGGRIGQGGGYYDRYLARCPAYRIAPAYACQVYDYIPISPWDQAVHALATPDGLYATGEDYE